MLDSATGINQAEIIYETLNQWDLLDKVKAMSFDTTAVNTGKLFF